MKRIIPISFSVAFCVSVSLAQEAADKHHVYVGARVCATCHQSENMGHQLSKWLASKHASAYAVLAKPEAREIADLSGIPEEPQEAHSTEVEREPQGASAVASPGVQVAPSDERSDRHREQGAGSSCC